MQKITFRGFKEGKGFASWGFRDECLKRMEGLKDDDIVISFAYTDYGGDFFDNVTIEYFSNKEYENVFNWENTAYYGKNGILWGIVAKEFLEDSENYPLGFRDIEDFYFEKERECQEKQAQEFLDQYKEEGEKLNEHKKNCAFGLICDKLAEHSILSSGTIDICESDLEEALEEFLENGYHILLSEEKERIANAQYYYTI